MGFCDLFLLWVYSYFYMLWNSQCFLFWGVGVAVSFRLGEAVDRTLLNHLLKMFTALGIYSESFEKPFLECTSEFYAAEGMKYMQQSDIPDYLKHVEVMCLF